MTPLDQYPRIRSALYLIQWIASGVLLIMTAVVAVLTEGNIPVWLVAMTAGLNVFTTYTGLTARGNVSGRGETPEVHDIDFGGNGDFGNPDLPS